MKILQISNYYYPHIGGIEQTSRDIIRSLGEHDRRVFCFNHEKGDKADSVDGVEIVRAGCFAKVASQSLSFSYGKLLKKTFREFQPDLVIFHFPNPFGAHYLKKLLKRYPACRLVVWWHLDITRQKLLGKLFEGQTKWLLRRAAKVVATSPNYIDGSAHLSSVREKCTVIPSCIGFSKQDLDEAVLSKAEEIRRSAVGKHICFALGRHVPYKGMEYLVRASALLDDRFEIDIAGSGPLTEELRNLAQADSKVHFLGRINDADRLAYLLACDIFCFPSITKNEAFGLALAEAMAFGKPAVTFTIEGSGVNYVSLDGVTGIECPNRDVGAYAAAIRRLAEDDALRARMGAAAKARAEENFTYERFADNVNRMIAEL